MHGSRRLRAAFLGRGTEGKPDAVKWGKGSRGGSYEMWRWYLAKVYRQCKYEKKIRASLKLFGLPTRGHDRGGGTFV